MSLKFDDRATPQQEVLLTDLGYLKSRTNWPLTKEQASQIINELLAQKKVDEQAEANKYGNYDQLKYSQEELDDPFSEANKRRT
jgi:hypothetical protein